MDSRPELNRLMVDAGRRRFDVVIVWRFDRFARSVSHLLRALEQFQALGIDFLSLSKNVDTSTPTGKMVFTILGAVAELERSLIVECVKAGIRNARAKGKKIGRPGNERSWLPFTLLTQYIFRRITRPCTGRDSIRDYLRVPRSHGVSDLAFDVTYIKQSGDVAWDVGTYRMSVPQNDGTTRQDHGKYLTVWKRAGKNWLIAADAWSSDVPPTH
jgi:hypothetical protein